MAMTYAEKMAYQRGYQRGAKWPDHKPPLPPDTVIAGLMDALRSLRDECDSALACFDPDDPLELQLGPKIEAADDALRLVGRWLLADDDGERTKAANCMAARRYYERNKEAVCAFKRRKYHEQKGDNRLARDGNSHPAPEGNS
jgi:hypothetical protein